LGSRTMDWPRVTKSFRVAQGYTQKRLAELIGADATSVSRWERGRDLPSPLFQERLTELIRIASNDVPPPAASASDNADWPSLIKKLRKCRKWSQTHLSEILGVDPTTISRWERGRDTPSLAFQKLLKVHAANT